MGLVGYQTGSGSISQSYALGAVSGSDYVGGLLGANSSNGTADQSYATGLVASAGANVGGLMGYDEGGAVTNSYWDIDTTGQGGSFGGTGLHTSAFFTASNLGGFTFGTTPGAGGWVIVDQNGTLNNASGAPGGTRPMLLSEWSANIVNAHQLQLTALDLGAAYTLAANIDASATADANPADVWAPSGFAPIGGSASNFTGAFNGEGHAITGLTIDQPTGSDVGLFGATSSTSVVQDLSLVGGSITALANVGALAGTSGGTVSNVQSSVDVTGFFLVGGLIGEASGSITGASVSGTTTGEIVPGSSSSGNPGPLGGLIGQLDAGSVTGSHVTGAVTAADGSSIGGLIGTTNTGATVDSSYATGAVTANPVTNGGSQIGGLIGDNLGAVTNSYATGAVTGEFMVGGLIGTNDSTGSVARSYATGAVAAAVDASSRIVRPFRWRPHRLRQRRQDHHRCLRPRLGHRRRQCRRPYRRARKQPHQRLFHGAGIGGGRGFGNQRRRTYRSRRFRWRDHERLLGHPDQRHHGPDPRRRRCYQRSGHHGPDDRPAPRRPAHGL